MKNRFNRLTSKEWLPFQKSWFRYDTDEKLFKENIRFFIREEPSEEKLFYWGDKEELVRSVCATEDVRMVNISTFDDQPLQFAIFDLRNTLSIISYLSEYEDIKLNILTLCEKIFHCLADRRFIVIMLPNIVLDGKYYPVVWDMALQLSSIFSLKDEKIACTSEPQIAQNKHVFTPNNKIFYCLYFRKDENSGGRYKERHHQLFKYNEPLESKKKFTHSIPSWFILKPQPRKKDEILHPAKYPEELVSMFINEFTEVDDNVFDPMSGTGSTQVASLRAGRNAFGTELSDFFAAIAIQRCQNIVQPTQIDLFGSPNKQQFSILHKDAREITKEDFPMIDYLITSPPYWDMLNMKGAENQAKRVVKGLQTNYSESTDDLGNIADYQQFVSDLTKVYLNILDIMKSGSYLTIVVKNIKKKGRNYPFAWDLTDSLMGKLILLPETFWCQDDINLAPYGYGNTFVSNTFHQYCLNFQKP
ncbi:MAG: site-specific DNA-methyltransferase [Saprospiraceae bacterium]|nr:site-specific DNA-methyltransferase [Saprospiraceae bacterium]